MKKTALSLLVVVASGAYVWDQAQETPETGPSGVALLGEQVPAAPVAADPTASAPVPAPPVPVSPAPEVAAPAVPARTITQIAQADTTSRPVSGLADGSYSGPSVGTVFGPVQIGATISGGKLVSLKALQYPSDRRTSVAINRQALPMLRDQAIAAQSAEVDIVTGATVTSEAFVRSLGGALRQAGG